MLKILLFCSVFVFSSVYGAPNESKFGKDLGYPLATNPWISEQNPYTVAEYSGERLEINNLPRGWDREHHWVRKSGEVVNIPEKKIDFGFFNNPDSWVERHAVLAVVIYKEGHLIYEKYQYGRNSRNRFTSQSMAKTLTAMMMGFAVKEKNVNIESKTSDYIVELKGTDLGDTTIRRHLQMATGSDFNYDNFDSVANYYTMKFAAQECFLSRPCGKNLLEIWPKAKVDPLKIGKFNYDPMSSDILSLIIARLYGKPLKEVFEEKIYSKIGAERDAFWRKVYVGHEITSGANFFHATPRDWIKISRLWFENDLVDKQWLTQMNNDSVSTGNSNQAKWGKWSPPKYGYQTWVFDGFIAMAGHRGQKLLIDSENQTIMLVSSLNGTWTDDGFDFWNKIRKKSLKELTQ